MSELAIVTGAASGIGRALTELLAREQPDTFILAIDRAEASDPGGRISYLTVDLADESALTLVRTWIESCGHTPVALANCAAIQFPARDRLSTQDSLDAVMSVNFRAALGMCWLAREAFLGSMTRTALSIVNVTSVHATVSEPGNMSYVASKSALEAASRNLASEWAPLGVRVNCVRPGSIDTPMNEDVSLQEKRRMAARIPLRRLGSAIEVAEIISFLMSQRASYVTGASWVVDGGLTSDGSF